MSHLLNIAFLGSVFIYWLLIAFSFTFYSYCFSDKMAVRWKKPSGKIPILIKTIIAPYLLLNRLMNRFKLWRETSEKIHHITDNLFVGARLSRSYHYIVKKESIDCILDVTAEYGANKKLMSKNIEYHCVPIFDHWIPTQAQVLYCCQWIHKRRLEGKNILVHCALGRGRSVLIVLAYLLSIQKERDVEQTLKKIAAIRKQARLNKQQKAFLNKVIQTKAFSKKLDLLLIANPQAGKAQWHKHKALLIELLSENYNVTTFESELNKSADKIAQDTILQQNVDLLVACGGDGTLSQLADVAIKFNLPLAAIPLGTSNSLTFETQGILSKLSPIEHACRTINQGDSHAIDCAYYNNSQAYLLMLSLGLNASMIANSPNESKTEAGELAYINSFFKALIETPVQKYQVTLDDQDPMMLETRSLIFANAAPPQTIMARFAGQPDFQDGFLDLLYIDESAISGLTIMEIVKNSLTGKPAFLKNFKHKRFKTASIQAQDESPLTYAVDGEIKTNENHIQISVKPKALRLIY